MKTIIISLFSSMLLLAGCQSSPDRQTSSVSDPNATKLILIGTHHFPQEMEGIWQNQQFGWMFKIDDTGHLTKIRHTIGRVYIEAGQEVQFPLLTKGKAQFEPGPWYVQYDAKTKTIEIEINIKHFEYNIAEGETVKGSSKDIFTGKLPTKGGKTWRADWLSFPKYVASTADEQYKNYKLPFEEGDEEKGEIVFEKVDPKTLIKINRQ